MHTLIKCLRLFFQPHVVTCYVGAVWSGSMESAGCGHYSKTEKRMKQTQHSAPHMASNLLS